MILCFLIFFIQIFSSFSQNVCLNDVCYWVSEAEVGSYDEATDSCVSGDKILAIVKDSVTQEALRNETNISNQTFYIGLKYIEKENFVWQNGIFDVPNLIWDESMPEVKDEACVYMTASGMMSMGLCSEKRRFICSNKTIHYTPEVHNSGYCQQGFFRFLNYCYKLNFKCSDTTYTWFEANTYCKSLNSTLLVIDSRMEQDFISTLMTISPQPSWTGLIHKNISKHISLWIDNTTNTVPRFPIKFKFGEPNGHRTQEEHCLMVYNRLSNIGYFNDEVCYKSLNYICKSPAIKNDSNFKKENQILNPLYKRGRCKEDYYEFNETCIYLKHLQKTYHDSNLHCKNKTLEIYNSIHIAFIRSLMSHTNISDVWISVYDKNGKVNGAMWLVNETSNNANFLSPKKCYIMTTQLGIGTAKSCDLTNIATACYYYLDMHEKVRTEFLCPKGWMKVGLKCFKVFHDYETFEVALSHCNNTNSKLATLTSMKEVQSIDSKLTGNAWIGINGDSYLRNSWIDGSSIDYCLFRHTTNLIALIKKNPDSICFVLKHKKGEWDDKLCSESNAFVCEMPATVNKCSVDFPIYIDGDCYGNFDDTKSWSDAESLCQRKGGHNTHLASFHSLVQEIEVFSQIKDLDEHWIGMKIYNFKKMWIDGSLTNYLRFYTNLQIDDAYFSCFSSQKVQSKSNITDIRWNLDNCEIKRKFICKVSSRNKTNISSNNSNIINNGYCPHGFLKFKNSCFKIVNETATWSNAVKMCRDMGVDKVEVQLASFKSKEEFEFVLSQMRDFSNYFWIGLYKDKKTEQFVWMDETPLTFVNFIDYINKVSILPGDKTAMFVSSNPFKNGYWTLASDITNLPYICRTDPYETSLQEKNSQVTKCPIPFNTEYNGFCYYYNDAPLSFSNAFDFCTKKSSDLLVIDDTFEEQFIKYFLIDKSRSNKLIWMGFRIDASSSMMANWVTPTNIQIFYTHWKDVISRENDHVYTDFNPQSKIHGCYTFNYSSNQNIFKDHTFINNAMTISSCDISIPSICKVALSPNEAQVSSEVTCAKSRGNTSYDIRVNITKHKNPCIRWDIVKTINTLDYHLNTYLYSSVPFNKDGYVSYSLNRCSELNNNRQEFGYGCYIFKDGKYILESCDMMICGSMDQKSSNKSVLIILFTFSIILIILCSLFLFRVKIFNNYRFRAAMAHLLGRYQPDWIGDANRPHTSPGGGVGFTNPVYTPLDDQGNMAL